MSKKKNVLGERLYNGLLKENPTFVLMLGMCPTLAVTTSAINGLGMGLTTMVVLALSNMIISLEQSLSPEDYALIKAYYIDEKPIDEICADTNLTPNALRVRIHRIKKYLSAFFIFLVIIFYSKTHHVSCFQSSSWIYFSC